jgi:mannose-6-phosphate isomerase-like protein (cupin superfamily)
MNFENITSEENLERLRELTEKFINFNSITKIDNTRVDYRVGSGHCEGNGVFNDDRAAIQVANLGVDTIFPPHAHNENEILICIQGEVIVSSAIESRLLKVGDVIKIEPGMVHNCFSKDGATIIGITIPASEGYPDA